MNNEQNTTENDNMDSTMSLPLKITIGVGIIAFLYMFIQCL